MRLLRRDPELRRWAKLAAFVCAVCFTGLAVGLYYGIPGLIGSLWTKPEDNQLALAFWYISVALLYLVGFVVGAQTLPVIVLSPVIERLSIATEKTLGVKEGKGGVMRFVAETSRAVFKAIIRVAVLIAGHVLLLALWLIPGAGQAVWTVASALWSMSWLAFEYIDVTANRHGLGFRQVLALLAKHPGGTLALGAGVYLLLWIPIVNVFFMPIAVVTAALYFRGSIEAPLTAVARREE